MLLLKRSPRPPPHNPALNLAHSRYSMNTCYVMEGQHEEPRASDLLTSSEAASAARRKASSGKGTSSLFRLELEKWHPFHIKINYIAHLRKSKTDGNKRETQGVRLENQAHGAPTPEPLFSWLLSPPGSQGTSRETAASLLSFHSSEIGAWISSGWLKLKADKSGAMLIGGGKEFEEVTRNATSSTIKKASHKVA